MTVLKKYKIRLYFIISLFIFSLKMFGQQNTYSVKVIFSGRFYCEYDNFYWNLSSGTNSIASNSGTNDINEKVYPNVPNYNSFSFYLNANTSVEPCLSAQEECVRNTTITNSAVDLIKHPYLQLGGCDFMVGISEFKPNVTIRNLDTANPNETCAGFQLELAAFPARFPDAAYHWQYSLDNVSWTDIPDFIKTNKTNNINKTKFSIYEILGDNHTNYFGKLIYFRLGYDQNRAFTDALSIKYSPCAPIITNITYEGPKCSGDPIQKVDVTFDRPLYPGESLDRIKMRNTSNGSERNEYTNISSFSTSNPKVYSFTNLVNALENGHSYKIVYQAQMVDPLNPSKKIMKGFMESASHLNFTYVDPLKVQFKITNYTEPSCSEGNDGTIEIKVLSGRYPYKFYLDDIIKTPIKIDSQNYIINELSANSIGYRVKITDNNNCIEK